MSFEGVREDFRRETSSDLKNRTELRAARLMENRLAKYQREAKGEIVERFRANSVVAADPRGATFDPYASHTVVPDWMRTAIAV